MKFANGMNVSVQWGMGTWSDNKWFFETDADCRHSSVAEVAVMLPGEADWISANELISGREDDADLIVAGYCTPEEVVQVLEKVSKFTERDIKRLELIAEFNKEDWEVC